MSILHLHVADQNLQLELDGHQSVREALDLTAWRVRAACGGTGTCGACVVRWRSGEVSAPTLAEYQKLTPEEREAGQRLACQLYLRGDAHIELPDPAPPSPWKSLPAQDLPYRPQSAVQRSGPMLALAVDLGTTHIRLSLWDRRRGQRIASRAGPNPQAAYGADVLNRLQAANSHPQHRRQLADCVREAIVQAVRDILMRDVGEVSPMLAEIGPVLIVGNSAMLALLSGAGGEALIDPDNWPRPIDCAPVDPQAWQAAWPMPQAGFRMPAPLSGFVGSDLLADVLATGLCRGSQAALLLDIGTNCELALWDGERLLVSSVPGGPAFEGCGSRHGMSAEAGAVCRVEPDQGGGYRLDTLAGGEARGFCGSGLVDAVALLRAAGILKPSGRFAISPGPQGLLLDPAAPRSALFGADVDALQRAKGALAAGMECLLAQAGLGWSQIGRLCLCGAFGRGLDLAHAQAIGLLPPLPPERIECHAEASLSGCEQALLEAQEEDPFAALRSLAHGINLSTLPDFEFRFIDHLRLRPMPLEFGATDPS